MQGWASGARENDGVLLSGESGAGEFYSSDDANASRRPRLEIEYACACGDACSVPQGSGALLLVVGNSTMPAAQDQSLRARFEAWGYTVSLIDDGDAASAFTTAVTTQDLAYVSGTVSDITLGTKLTALAIGIVSEAGALNDELGFAAGATTGVAVELGVVDNSHYLTASFVPGNVQIQDLPMRVSRVSGTEAAGLQTLANAGGAGALSIIEKGGLLRSGAAAAARRVKLPFDGTGGIDWNHVNGNGLVLLSRALAWAGNADVALDLGPVAHWKLDEGAGSVAFDTEGGHDGTLTGPIWVAGKVGGALSFDGVDDFVRVPHDAKLNFSGELTLSAWMNTNTLTGSYRTIVNKGASGTQQDYWLGIYNGELRFTFYASGAYRRVGFAPGFAVGTWYHVAASFEDATDRVRLYVDGVEVANGLIAYTPPTGTYDLLIGKSNVTSQVWNGLLDDVRIYDRVLDADEIAAVAADSGGGVGMGGGSLVDGGTTPPVEGCKGTYRDQFKSTTYSGSDGTLGWTGDWAEVNEADGAKNGDEVVEVDPDATSTPGSNQLRVQDNDGGGEGVVRALNLKGAAVATLSLRYRRDALDAADEYVAIGISKTGTTGPFSEIVRLKGVADDKTYQSFSQDISAYASETTAIRLLGSSSMGGSDAVWFDDVEVSCTP